MKIIVFIIVIIALIFTSGENVSAHVLITDETNSKGAVLHIIPDDDPISGETATLYFDMQHQLSDSNTIAMLIIKDETDRVHSVETKIDGSLVTADFIFPVQGIYDLEYTVISKGETYTFHQTQRISRGAFGSYQDLPSHTWAELLLLTSTIGLAFLLIITTNRRNIIAKQSTF